MLETFRDFRLSRTLYSISRSLVFRKWEKQAVIFSVDVFELTIIIVRLVRLEFFWNRNKQFY